MEEDCIFSMGRVSSVEHDTPRLTAGEGQLTHSQLTAGEGELRGDLQATTEDIDEGWLV